MDRKTFLKLLALVSLSGRSKMFAESAIFNESFENTVKMPALFLGHGSPANAVEDNVFTKGFREIGESILKPKAIICISAHWETDGTQVTAMEHPKTIHDFYGFQKELFLVEYPAPGNPELAERLKGLITKTDVSLDYDWGLDHGTWSVLKFLYPDANIPIIQLSLDKHKSARWHYELAKELAILRNEGILIVGSGDIVHNLANIDWKNTEKGFDWAEEANAKIINMALENDFLNLIDYKSLGDIAKMAIPSPEHYLPFLYIMALRDEDDKIEVFNNKVTYGSISMASFRIG